MPEPHRVSLATKEVHKMTQATELAEAHWSYVESVIRVHGADDQTIKECAHHYKTAFAHGYKHGVEDAALKDPAEISPGTLTDEQIDTLCTSCLHWAKCGGATISPSGKCVFRQEATNAP
jgi:hypothetical protein